MDSIFEQLVAPAKPISGGSDNDPPIVETPPAAVAAPGGFVPADEFKSYQATMQGNFDQLQQTIGVLRDALVATRPAAPTAPAAGTPGGAITEEQYVEAIQTGDARTVRAFHEQDKQRLITEHINPLRDTGLDAIAGITREMATGQLAYYKKYQKEIDAHIANLPTNMRMTPQVYRLAHDAVVGSHIDEITTEAREAAIRAPAVPEPMPGSGRTGRTSAAGAVPTVEELMGKEASDALAFRGMDGDMFARKLGYKSWADYAKLAAEV